jgi:hypothetical protein
MKDLKHIKRFNESEENLNISDVINQRELLISFLTWVREDYREDISIEYLVDYWLEKRNQ